MGTDKVFGDSAASTVDAAQQTPAPSPGPAAPVPLPVASAMEVGHAEDPAERDADRQAKGALDRLRRSSAEPPVRRRTEGGPVVRRVLAGPLQNKNAQYLINELKISYSEANRAIKAERELSSLDEVRTFLAEKAPQKPDPRMLDGASAATGPVKTGSVVSGSVSSSSLTESSAKSDKEDLSASSSEVLPRAVVPSDAAKSHQPVSRGGRPLIVNFVSVGPSGLDDVSRFNIYSWRALGHTVNIFTHSLTWTSGAREAFAPKRHAELGLAEEDANVVDLSGVIAIAREGDRVTDAPSLLSAWLKRAPVGAPPKQYIFNVGDVVKSYVGGRHRGITMDLKVGPSLHLQDYADDFATRFISYSRGGQSSGPVENQSMGTMQEDDTLRGAYRAKFDSRVSGLAGTDPVNDVNFNLITGYHGEGWTATRAGRDVAKHLPVADQETHLGKKPTGFSPQAREGAKAYDEAASHRMSSQYGVEEIGDQGAGPFRVFKKASDQTNKSGNKPTTDAERVGLMEFAWETELEESGGERRFLDKARSIKEQFAKKVAEEEKKA